jgi:hypothetical protein
MARNKKSTTEIKMAKEIKRMETAKKEAAAKAAPKPKAKPLPETISFDVWWMGLVRKITIRPSYKEIIVADFKARGLSAQEKSEDYDKALELFGIKL